MSAPAPDISVVVATRNRASRLAGLLDSLREQTIGPDRFEVIVVDDASSDRTGELLADELRRGGLRLTLSRRSSPGGPAVARNDGWRSANASVVAFIDDDCVASAEWLEQGLRACAASPGAIVQGRVDPIASESHAISPFTRTLYIHDAGPYFQTCNIFYPRELLRRLDGFDPFFTMPGGEDTDLAWRAIAHGVPTQFAPRARAFHAVNKIGPLGRLRVAAHWHESMVIYKRHPALRDAVFTKGVFWKPWHYALFRVAIALMLPRRLWFVRPYLIIPYVRSIELRCRNERGSLVHALFYPVEDVVEVGAMLRASARHRMLVL